MIVIFGGTGSLGHALTKIASEAGEDIIIVSRDELKQKKMAELYPDVRFVLGDVASDEWMSSIVRLNKWVPPSHVFNLAAFKHVDIAENNVQMCMRTNYDGVVNTHNWSTQCGAKYIFSNTDKAVLPINLYGASKLAAQKYIDSCGMGTSFYWGNVLGSRGSVLQAFKKSLLEEKKVYITDTRMTRFWIELDSVAEFMWENKDRVGETLIHPKMKAATLDSLAEAVALSLGIGGYEIEVTGIRPGEKIHECLRTGHDYCITSENCDQYERDELIEIVGRNL